MWNTYMEFYTHQCYTIPYKDSHLFCNLCDLLLSLPYLQLHCNYFSKDLSENGNFLFKQNTYLQSKSLVLVYFRFIGKILSNIEIETLFRKNNYF